MVGLKSTILDGRLAGRPDEEARNRTSTARLRLSLATNCILGLFNVCIFLGKRNPQTGRGGKCGKDNCGRVGILKAFNKKGEIVSSNFEPSDDCCE